MSPSQRPGLCSTRRLLGALASLVLLGGCPEPWIASNDQIDQINGLWGLPSQVRDPTNALVGNAAARDLGEELFNDPGLSGCGTVSCATCHDPQLGFTHRGAGHPGCDGVTPRNAPTLLNVGHSDWFMWDGRADRLWNQAILPMTSPVEMAATPSLVRARLQEGYATEYEALFGKQPQEETDDNALLANTGKVLAAYQSTLNTQDSPFDEAARSFVAATETLGGEQSHPSYLGFFVFVEKGKCIVCHKGPMLSDGDFHSVGVRDMSEPVRDGRLVAAQPLLDWPFRADGAYSDAPEDSVAKNRLANLELDLGKTAEREAMRGAFRTPTLRNIAETAPYMHTGEYATLEDVVELYDKGGEEVGQYAGVVNPDSIHRLDLTEEEKAALVELLKSMSAPLR